MTRLAMQVVVLVAVSVALGMASNALRPQGIDWSGRDPERFRHPDVEFLDVETAASLHAVSTTLFLDARAPEAFAAGHVFGAVSLPADNQETAYEELRDFLGPEMTFVVYSDDSMLAVRVAKFLNARGFKAQVLEGGWEAWQDRRLPVE